MNAVTNAAAKSKAGLRELTSYLIPGGSGMRKKRCVVGVRCFNHLVDEFTHPDSVGGSDPKWEHGHHGRVLHVQRHKKDDHVAVATVYSVQDNGTRTWLGGNHFKFTEALNSPNKEHEQDVPLFVSGRPQGGAGSGILTVKFKWVPTEETSEDLEQREAAEEEPELRGRLVVTVICATGLVMPDRIVRDLTTHVDGAPVKVSIFLLFVYLVVGFGFYWGWMAQSLDGETSRSFEKFPELLDRLQGGHGDCAT